jgi:hypothetical protein
VNYASQGAGGHNKSQRTQSAGPAIAEFCGYPNGREPCRVQLHCTTGRSTVLNLGSDRLAHPNLVGSPELLRSQRTVEQWFNTDAVTSLGPTPQAFNAGVGIMRSSGLASFDFSIASEHLWENSFSRRREDRAVGVEVLIKLQPIMLGYCLFGGLILVLNGEGAGCHDSFSGCVAVPPRDLALDNSFHRTSLIVRNTPKSMADTFLVATYGRAPTSGCPDWENNCSVPDDLPLACTLNRMN